MEESKKLNIYQKMLKATEKISKVAKNLKVDINKSASYKAVSEADVLEAVKPIEIELGIYSYPVKREIIETNILDTVKEYNGNRTESKQLFMRLEVTYRFVNVDNPQDYIDIITYDKYALLKAYKIQTGEDPDKEGSGDLKGIKKTNESKKIVKATASQIETMKKLYSEEELQKALTLVKKAKLEDMTVYEASNLISKRTKKEEVKENE